MKLVNVYERERRYLGAEEGGRWGVFYHLVSSHLCRKKRQQRAMLRAKRREYEIDYTKDDDFPYEVFIERYFGEQAVDSPIFYE
jgi:hypothetical protein